MLLEGRCIIGSTQEEGNVIQKQEPSNLISQSETSAGDSNPLPIVLEGVKSVGPLDGPRDDGVILNSKLILNLNFALVMDAPASGQVDAEPNLTPSILTIMDKKTTSQ